MRVFYLHGFASSSHSSKATFLRSRLALHGIALHAPDLNEPDFSTLTVTRMIARVVEEIDRAGTGPSVLIGSSLGAFVAIQVALQRAAAVDRLVLLAPALDFGGNRMRDLAGHGIEEWKRTNRLDVFHYGYARMMPVHYELYTDASRYDAMGAAPRQPVQVFQGTRDAAVNPATVRQWASSRANVELHMLDDDHQLLASMEFIWREMSRFFGLGEPGSAR